MKATFEQWSKALAMIESGDCPFAFGDYVDGLPRACGRWQMHVPFVMQWVKPEDIRLGMTWDELFQKCLQRFYDEAVRLNIGDIKAACGFHKHGDPTKGNFSECPQYAKDMIRALQKEGVTVDETA